MLQKTFKKFIAEVLRPVTRFRKYMVSDHTAIINCKLLRAAIIGAKAVGH
jgi:hypothetical protein